MPKRGRTSYFTNRGKHFGNLWAVYSFRAKDVLLLSTDRQLAHWLLYLEFSSSIASFSFKSGTKEFSEKPNYILNYHAEVLPVEGCNELHYLQAEGNTESCAEKILVARKYKYNYREFNDEDWLPRRDKILPLLKVASYLAGSRSLYIPPTLLEKALHYILTLRSGTLRGFLSALADYEKNLILVVFSRAYSERLISVDFEFSFFSQDTHWRLNEI
ncbi:hypothetical protein J3P75_14185 [Pseudomonas sp. R1-1]|uniref:hypothetical protein n=1 Tax=Pseudomonas sp. R1-1 TaxID=1602529 RepID=UPI003DA83E75